MCAKKNLSKNEKLYIFKNVSNMLNILQILNNLIFNQEKLKMCKFPLKRLFAKNLQFFFAKLVQFFSLCQRLSQKAKFYLTSGSGSKQRFSLLQENTVVQAVCLRTQAVSIKARF